jgi:DNA-binding response OmpR family regulator
MSRILVIGGESQESQGALAALSLLGAQPLLAPDLSEAQSALTDDPPDLIAVSLALRSPDDEQVAGLLEACRGASPAVPVLALIPSTRLKGYEALDVFDDFAVSPYNAPELAARMQRLLRLAKPREESTVLAFGDLLIDLARYEVTQEGRRMDLTFKEYELLKFLASNPGKVFTRETLLNRVWGYDYYGGTRTVDVHIRRLRSKIENGPHLFIDTVRNVGYRFQEPR